MLLTITEFRGRVETDMPGLVGDLQDLTGRYSDSEADAWRSSLPVVAQAFASPALAPLHLYFGGQGKVALEYRLPSASSWCDMVLLGRHDDRPVAGIIEIKDWETRGDRPGAAEGLIERHTGAELHPSDQVRGYSDYCRRFHSTVLERNAEVHGCVLFTRSSRYENYEREPNHRLTADYPIFSLRTSEGVQQLESYFSTRLTVPDEDFARDFEKGIYQQDRSFVRHIGSQLSDSSSTPFELLDGQRRAFALVRNEVRSALHTTGPMPKKVVVVIGPPGSGKSVIAGKLWADIVSNVDTPEGNVVFVTTSASQNSNWAELFRQASGARAASGAVVKANEFIPITTQQIGRLKKKFGNLFQDVAQWRENLRIFQNVLANELRTPDGHHLVSIVDEAHALINPEHGDSRGQFGFAIHAGPQAYHIIRGSQVSVFLMDAAQQFRERETTTLDDIQTWAAELGAGPVQIVSLEGSQFRCGGSVEYLDWVEEVLRNSEPGTCQLLARRWHCGVPERMAAEPASPRYGLGTGPQNLEFGIAANPAELERLVRERLHDGRSGRSGRLLASYGRPWATKGAVRPHELPAEMMDFNLMVDEGGRKRRWSKVWNFVPKGDYSVFIHGPLGSQIYDDPLCEIGCPYAVRGFDFDYVGLLWLSDLKWRKDRWVVDLDHVHESGLSRHVSRARKEEDPHGPEHQALLLKLQQAYRILLTRAMRGVFIWFEDDETRERVQEALR